MSETDDTDDLLLIPPDFFLVHSELEPPYFSIVDSLIKQVSTLQNRIETIEATSDLSLAGSNLDQSFDVKQDTAMFNTNNVQSRRYLSHDNLYQPTSTQSTPQKPNAKMKLNSLPNSPNIDRISPRRNSAKLARSPQRNKISTIPKKINNAEDTEVLHEIDNFISNVKTIQRNHAVRNLQNDFESHRVLADRDPSLGTNIQTRDRDVQDTLNELDRRSQTLIEKKLKEEGGVNNSKSVAQEKNSKDKAWRCGDAIESVPDYGAGFRNTLYRDKETNEPPIESIQMIKNPDFMSSEFTSCTTLNKSDSSSDSTQLTAYNRYKNQEELNKLDNKYEQYQKDQKLNQKFNDVFRVNQESKDPYIIDQERNELLHSPLHDNALSVLDMHQKLLGSSSTGVRVDQVFKKREINPLSHNLGFLSLADIWGTGNFSQSPSKLAQKLQEERLRRQHCEQLIQDLQNKNLELQQKLAVAVKVDDTKNNTLHHYREALDKVSARMEKLNEEKSTWEREVTKLKNQHTFEIEAANQKISYYEKEASKALNLAHTNQEKILSLEKRCSDLQHELESIETKFKEVEENFKVEVDRNKLLADILTQKEIELKENKAVLNSAREEVAQSRKAVEVCQTEFTALKNECAKLQTDYKEEKNVVLNLSEQKKKLLNDLQIYKSNEKMLKDALEQTKLKLESTKVELRNFYQGQLEIIVENKRKEMQTQLDTERQNNMEELKKKEMSMAKTAANHIKQISENCAMETKLLERKHQEELGLYQIQLSKYKAEIDGLQAKLSNLPEKRAQIAKQLQKVMETQFNEALKMMNGSPTSFVGEPDEQTYNNLNSMQPKQSYTKVNEPARQTQARVPDTFESVSDFDETPVSSRGPKQSEGEIQKYINMLLNRPPGNPLPEAQDLKRTQSNDRATWNPGDQENQNKADTTKMAARDKRSDKPPWK